MEVIGYFNTSSVDTCRKDINEVVRYRDVIFKDGCSIRNPIIIINGLSVNDASLVTNVNYFKIPKFDRYYFVDDVTLLSANRFQYTLRCDVLMTAYDNYKSEDELMVRYSDASALGKMLNDSEWAIQEDVKVTSETIGTFTKANSCILMTTGTGGEE